jgi:uncharacterized membrane protein
MEVPDMPEASTSLRRRRKQTSEQADGARGEVQDTAQDAAPADEGDDGGQEERGGDESRDEGKATITGELKDTFREAAIEVLKPVLRSATKSAAKYAVTQGPSMVKDKVGPKLEEAGGAGALVKGVASKGGGVTGAVGGLAGNLMGGGKKKEGESPSGTGRGRRLPVQEFVDVGADLETVYDQFTQFEDWPQFMHRVERIEQRDETTLMWHENIWGVRRSWEAEITDQTPCERIAWRSKSGPQSVGVVTFHRLSDNLTRVYITMDFQPKGLFEKTASGMRISRRALKSDLMRFKAFVEMRDEATGAWRGEIEDGEVVDSGDEQGDDAEAREDEDVEARGEDEESEAEEGEEPEAEEGEEEPTASEDEEGYEDEDEDAEEDEEEPRSRSGSGRFQRESDSESEPEDESDEEPTASEDEEDQGEEEEEAPPAPRRRPARAASQRRRAPASSRGTR